MKHAVVTGGTGGLGRAIAAELTAPHWHLTAIGSSDLDLLDQSSIGPWFANQSVDLLVCTAGIISDAPLARLNPSVWGDVMQVNFNAARDCARAAIRGMVDRGTPGHVVFISSYSAKHPPIGQAPYATAKAALLGLTQDLARQHGADGIRVNVILPGFLETPMTETVSEKRREQVLADHQLGQFNTCEAVARFVRFLHEELPFTSGQTFQLDSRLGSLTLDGCAP